MQSISHLKIEDFVTREEQGQGQMRGDPLYTSENYLLLVGDCIVYLRFLFVCVYWCTTHIVLCFSLSCIPYVASFFGLSFLDCPFGIL